MSTPRWLMDRGTDVQRSVDTRSNDQRAWGDRTYIKGLNLKYLLYERVPIPCGLLFLIVETPLLLDSLVCGWPTSPLGILSKQSRE
uniref:Uncharacterized protein n=1 Tax=Vespula pensylvanica TaxID=30213 RepID=A0A834UBA2_VESPE|nr:hypothetical protein H0235_007092 [Vespula pensylvanica]